MKIMKIGIIGGTGGMGKGFALRWSKNNDVIVGSRDAAEHQVLLKNIQILQKNPLEKLMEQLLEKIISQLQKKVMF